MEKDRFSPTFKNPSLQVIFGTTFMSIMGISLIAPTLSAMASELHIPKESIGLVITSFTVPGILLAFIIGMLADRYGRKQILAPSLTLFGIAGAACFFAKNIEMLLLLRILQGVGASGLVLLSTVLIGDIFHGIDRATAMGENASVLSIGSSISPLIGGAFASISWNYPFLLFMLAIPLSIAVLFMESPPVKTETRMSKYVRDIWSFARQPRPVIVFFAGALTFILLYGGIFTYFGVLLSDRFNASPAVIGGYFSIMSITAAIASSQNGKLQTRFTKSGIVLAGFSLYALALFLIPFMGSLPMLVLPLLLFGLGHGLNMPSLQVITTELAPAQYRGALVSMFGVTMKVGQSIGPPLLGIMLAVSNLHTLFIAAGVLTITASVSGFALTRFLERPATENA
ncbi:MAG TPA: MFS transporter [Anaerolineae bacterium]|jgi:MFS family permease|nr:MFS transporter [Anaerolineae bacterium]